MKILRFIILIVPLALVFCIGLSANTVARIADKVDDGCARLFKNMYQGK